jgi:putative nucleotidyltransferase with HDIG domain
MEKIKEYFFKHFEKIIVASVLLGIVLINYFTPYKMGFLNFFYLPIIAAGYFLGQRMAVLTAVFCILIVAFFLLLFPSSFFTAGINKTYIYVSLGAWSSFLILTSAAIGYLYEEKERKINDLRGAYMGILEILSKYLESADRYTQGHSVRVAHLSEDIARTMGLSALEVENVRAAALLHDIGKIEISLDVLHKAAALTDEEKELMDSHTEKGARILSLVGGVLKEAVPIVSAHHKYFFEAEKPPSEGKEEPARQKEPARKEELRAQEVPLGAAIIAVADAYDAMITDRPYRAGMQPWQAFEELEKGAGKQFRPSVVKAFKKVLISKQKYRK